MRRTGTGGHPHTAARAKTELLLAGLNTDVLTLRHFMSFTDVLFLLTDFDFSPVLN